MSSAVMHTIVIKGAHLCANWLSVLPSWLMESSVSFKLKYNEELLSHVKIVLLLEPKPYIPQSLGRVGWRVCLVVDSSPKEAFLDAVRRWPTTVPSQNKTESFIRKLYALLYISTALHIILDARRLYAPRGVALDPGWSQNDLTAIISIIQDCMVRGLPASQDENVYLLGFSKRLSGLLLDAIYGVATKDSSDNALLLEFTKISYNSKAITAIFELIDKGEKAIPATVSVEGNAQSYGARDIVSAINSIPVIQYLLPPAHVLCNKSLLAGSSCFDAAQLIDGIALYVQQCYPEKPVPNYLGLPTNALLTQSLKNSITTRSLLARISIQSGTQESASDGNAIASIYDTILQLSSIYEKDVKPKLTVFATKLKEMGAFLNEAQQTDPAIARIIPIIDELHLQGNVIMSIGKVLESDFKEAAAAHSNYLLASTRIKAIASLILSRILPERWCVGITAVPCPTAPHDSPELATLRSGDPFEYLSTFLTSASSSIASAYESCRQSVNESSTMTQIELALSDMPRPAAFIEAIRRYEGIAMGQELNSIKLVASSQACNKRAHPVITLKAGSCVLQGCSLRTLIDLNVESDQLENIYVYSADNEAHLSSSAIVPFYVDQLRESRVAGIEVMHVKMSAYSKEVDEMVTLNGIYVHLSNR